MKSLIADEPPSERHGPAADLRRQNEKLRAFLAASRALGEAVGRPDAAHVVAQCALELFEAETALVILHEATDRIVMGAAGRYGGRVLGLIFPIGTTGTAREDVWARVAEGAEALTQVAAAEFAAELLLPEAPGSAMLAPLRTGEASLGLLAALHSAPHRFNTGDLQLFQLLANHGAVALANARIIQTLRAQADALRHSQDQLIHNARMATVGRLTAALAHEINNPLQSILGSVQFVLEQLPAEDSQRPYLELAASELDRVSDIVRRMVGFYRRDEAERLPTDLNALVRETLALAEKQLQRHRIAVITDLMEGLPRAPVAPNQFKQVFLNLILNAADAMTGPPEGGKLEITSRRTDDGQIEICFSDNGPGIPPHELERIFESFYTTKPHGTGLGLSVSRDIVRRHAGDLLAESQAGQGAVFRVVLPASR